MNSIIIKNTEQLLNIKNMSEKLSQISLSFKIKLEEKKLFEDSNSLDVMDTILDFFINWTEEFETYTNKLSVNDKLIIKSSEKRMIKDMILFYETEVNGIDKNFLLNQSESFKEILESIGIFEKEMI
tara:strand:+ start:2557 stop:2937 length:381 start_codon:yes stop_codon:yes gene_type:complete